MFQTRNDSAVYHTRLQCAPPSSQTPSRSSHPPAKVRALARASLNQLHCTSEGTTKTSSPAAATSLCHCQRRTIVHAFIPSTQHFAYGCLVHTISFFCCLSFPFRARGQSRSPSLCISSWPGIAFRKVVRSNHN